MTNKKFLTRAAIVLLAGIFVSFFGSEVVRTRADLQLNRELIDFGFDGIGSLQDRSYALRRDLEALKTEVAYLRGTSVSSTEHDRVQDFLLQQNLEEVRRVQAALDDLLATMAGDRRFSDLRSQASGLLERIQKLEATVSAMVKPDMGEFVVPVGGTLVYTNTITRDDTHEVLVTEQNTEEQPDAGTGFIVSYGGKLRLVTAGHVFGSHDEERSGTVATPDGMQPATMRVHVEMTKPSFLWHGKRIDVQVLFASTKSIDASVASFDASLYDGQAPEVAELMPAEGDPIWVITNRPGLRDGQVFVPGVYEGTKGGDGPVAFSHIASTPIYFGYSGSPVVSGGKVIGIVVHMYPGSMMGMTPLNNLRETLDKTKDL